MKKTAIFLIALAFGLANAGTLVNPGGGGGSGTVASGTSGQVAVYTGTTTVGSSATPNIGAATGTSLNLSGSLTAGNIPLLLGTPNLNGVPYVTNATTGETTYGATLTTNQVVIGSSAGPVPLGSTGTSSQVFIGGAPPTWGSITGSMVTNGTLTGNKLSTSFNTITRTFFIGDTSGSTLTNAQLGPQPNVFGFNAAATLLEVGFTADAGTPNIIVGINHGGVISNVLSSALSTGASGAYACSKASAVTSTFNGSTTCAATLQNTSIAQGDFLNFVSGTAGGTAKSGQLHITYQVTN